MILQQAFELNMQGIFSLVNGKAGRTSIISIKQAMHAMDALYEDADAKQDQDTTMMPADDDDLRLKCRTVSVPGLQDDQFFIFNYAFLFAPTTNLDGNGKLSSTDMAYGCAVLTFNMALIYHQMGKQTGSSRKLRTACLLYGKVAEMARSAAESQGMEGSSLVGSDLFLLHMVAMNNAAEIQYSLAGFQACNELLMHVQYMMQQLYEEPMADVVGDLPAGAMDEIKLNTVVCSIPSSAPTA